MDATVQLGILAAATILATGVAFAMAWAFLEGAFRLMQPSMRPRLELVEGTRAAARAFGTR